MEIIHVAVAAAAAISVLTALSVMHGRAQARLIKEQVERCMDRVGALSGAIESELDQRDVMLLDISKAIVVLDRRVQRTINDPILALDEEGKLVVYEGQLPPMDGGDGSHG